MKPNIEYLFCINTGRSGSHYLHEIFKHVENCQVWHEAHPIGHGQAMRDYFFGKTELMQELTAKKFEKIQQIKKESDCYIETNHCFIKGFGWFLPKYISQEKIGVIILTRNSAQIVDSLLRINCSPLVITGQTWILTPDIKNYCIKPPNWFISPKITYDLFCLLKRLLLSKRKLYNWFSSRFPQIKEMVAKYEKGCLKWYVDETLALSRSYQEKFPNIKYFQIDVEALNNAENIRELLSYFGLSEKSTIETAIGKPTNLKSACRGN
ncbi:MAG: hypothetical protein N4J56_002468 [Chroococcidiopsis sp. SAG 2025]|uniref:hypothetical protein n=1 Tax=Chroococcidiopsis sp. SAG 2025 TaxID=171389 RepID=UPI00293721F4|nr:hypothetical protein [Chroococcidiopsis sp. SAG 2025]MDV2992814.1 hypothetical protein [Chroococcidiopsis sp. SAG 2025]